jgi:AbrB family looped-hinge helix DNA binding protein
MTRVTTKLQVTIPKVIAERYGIEPGDEIEFLAAGDAIRVVPPVSRQPVPDRARRLDLFDRASERQRARQAARRVKPASTDRGWRRDELYERGVTG